MAARSATLIGLTALLMWSLLAALTVATGRIPAFQLLAMTFAIGGGVGVLAVLYRSGSLATLKQPPIVWLIGVGGLFGYHALYFLALRFAPPAEAGLLNYLWPLLIVLLSSLLPGMQLRPHHVIGAMLGFAGTIVLFGGNLAGALQGEYAAGFVAAFCAAFVWAAYSVLSRRLASVPTEAVAGFCVVTAVLATLMHVTLETTVLPAGIVQLAIVALGMGPVGFAFFTWDIGMKRGDIRLLGAASYVTPLLSTLLLILCGYAKASSTLGLAALLITLGGATAAKDTFFRRA